MKKSIIKKAISRKLSTASYETLDISVEIQEEIEWDTIEERTKKSDRITKILLIDFNSMLIKTLEQLKLNKKLAVIKKQ